MALTPVILALSRSGQEVAHRIARIFGSEVHGREGRVDRADAFFPNALDHTRDLFAAGRPIIGVCASGILIRGVAPLLADKTTEPPVISVSDDGKVVVPLVGGHRGANRLAQKIATELRAVAAVTTAGDVALGVALDEPPEGWRLRNPEDAKTAMAALLSGEGATVLGDAPWLSDLPEGDGVTLEASISSDAATGAKALHFAPRRVAIGVGCARDCPGDELIRLVEAAMADANLSWAAVHSINSVTLKGDEPAMIELAAHFKCDFRLFDAPELDAMAGDVPNPSDVVLAEVGTRSVAEAAALCQAGAGSELLVEKRKSAHATCAIAVSKVPLMGQRGRSRGRLSIVGIGPGQASWRTPEVSQLVAQAEELVGYGLYIDLLGPLAIGKQRTDFPLGGEEDRCRYALEEAGKGKNVALVCSGDAGIYAMGALVFELMDRGADELGVSQAAKCVEVVCSPGVSALQGAAARAGAPLGHDFCAISLSDLLTPREDIVKRLNAAAEGDFVIAFYNPVSKRRRTLLAEARDILLKHRPADTPVMLASSLGRPEEHVRYRSLQDLDVDEVDMLTVVLVGSSHSRLAQLGTGPRMYTPRGYARKIDGDLAG